ncbi:Asp-tRNA(Asn)/Glu-tRNA(Gln) amidotransferase subunit GatC, partial [Lacticaseibacillus paracasei]
MISKDSVAHVAGLAKLQFSETELEKYTSQLSEILDMVEQLESVPTQDVPVTTQSIHLENV